MGDGESKEMAGRIARYRIVTPEQLKAGYEIKAGGAIWKSAWTVARKLDDGNFLVEEPEPWREFFV